MLVAGGCGGKKNPPPVAEAQPFADGFVQRLVVDGRWAAVQDDVSPHLSLDMRQFQQKIRSDGIRRVAGPGTLRHDCPVVPAADAGKDCFVYRLRGKQIVPIVGVVRLNADFRVWVSYEDGAWQVVNYDYTVIPS